MSRYLITGASGFIGLRLSNYLKFSGHEVFALLRKPENGPWDQSFCCDIGSELLPSSLMKGVDGVFHLANLADTGLTGSDAQLYWKVNVLGTKAVLGAAVDAGVNSFVYFSSVKSTSEPREKCVDERWDQVPDDEYGRSKREAENLVLAAGKAFGMHVCNLRPPLVYGVGVNGNLLSMMQAVRRGYFPPLPEFGNRISMVSLDDLVVAASLAMENSKANGQTYIVTDGVYYSPRSLYEAMCVELDISIPRWHIPESFLRFGAVLGDGLGWIARKNMPLNSAVLRRLVGSSCYRAESIKKDLGWHPNYAFSDVLPKMIQNL